ncbi:hypothetical protein EVAR_67008_1 [Eumeta japonica]|uniref:Uncharacterized protein n=1 Tax=Eumeta variegata TaxID=151549 RepID=A0A4C1ZUJ8_EUMVA|nr:hypothetical protein EVAR_67008_1 [Eumeta japonica]
MRTLDRTVIRRGRGRRGRAEADGRNKIDIRDDNSFVVQLFFNTPALGTDIVLTTEGGEVQPRAPAAPAPLYAARARSGPRAVRGYI